MRLGKDGHPSPLRFLQELMHVLSGCSLDASVLAAVTVADADDITRGGGIGELNRATTVEMISLRT